MSVTVLVGPALHISQKLLDGLLADYKHAETKRNVVRPAFYLWCPYFNTWVHWLHLIMNVRITR